MAWAEKRGRRWRAIYRDGEGVKRYAGRHDTKKQALEAAQVEEHRVTAGTWFDPNYGKLLFSTYFERDWLPNRGIAPTTYSGYMSYYRTELCEAFGNMAVNEITRGHVQRWVIGMERKGAGPKTVREKYRLLATVFDAEEGVSAVADGLVEKSPCVKIKLPSIPRRRNKVYTMSQVDAVMTRLDPWWEVMALVLADMGCRFGELQGLEVRDFDGAGFNIERTVVELTKKLIEELELGEGTQFYVKDIPKDGEERHVTLSPEVAKVVAQLIRDRELFPNDRIFAMHDGKGKVMRTERWPHGRPVVRSHFRTQWRAAHGEDVPMLKVHALRGSMISWLILAGVDVGAVMGRAGHSRLTTTQQYFDQFDDADQRAIAGLARAREASRALGAQ